MAPCVRWHRSWPLQCASPRFIVSVRSCPRHRGSPDSCAVSRMRLARSTQRATRTHAGGVRAVGHGLRSRYMCLSASIPPLGWRTSTLASLSLGVPRPFHANVTLVHRHRSSASSASPSSSANAATATHKDDLQRDMRAGHVIRATKSADARARTRARTHSRIKSLSCYYVGA